MSSLVIDVADGEPPLPGVLYPAAEGATGVVLVFAHGAGAGQASPFMRRYAELLALRGIAVVTFDFPYMAAGRKLPDRRPVLERAFLAALAAAATAVPATRALVVGGKSMGGRIATHLAATPERWPGPPPLVGAVAFGYPLRPPGPRGGDRVSHLKDLGVPTLVVQGTRDPFGGPEEVRAAVPGALRLRVLPVDTGDHSLKVLASLKRPQAEVEAELLDAVARWIGDAMVAAGVAPRA